MTPRPNQSAEPSEPESGLIVRIGRGGGGTAVTRLDGGWADKRAAIVEAAMILFLRRGYQATSTEQIAAAASVSKQTIYNHFGGKEQLFREIVLGVTATAERFIRQLNAAFTEITTADQVDTVLGAVARRYLATVTDPQLLALRRLVIGEAHRFPDLARDYYQFAPVRTFAAIAERFADLTDRGLLHTPDPNLAAEHFADLVIGRPLDRGLFTIDAHSLTEDEIGRLTTHAVQVFLAAYR